ncbi:Oxidoreductase probably involved in sulfite reduction [Candidatus Burkholderia brachyanthoides]|nr:Oxidoreductase probably involved in sulfite reduction [Candidatus Burkholderia brachyanthoides]
MTLIIKNRAVVEDSFVVVRAAEDSALPAVDALPAGKVIVPFALWKDNKDAIAASRAKEELGVWLAPDDEPADIVADFDKLAVIAVDFPVFRDGRGFSIGRLLRERYNWTGELRAIGDVLRDQVLFHLRCGFDAFAVRADKDINDALNAFNEFSELYQGAIDNPEPLFRRRNTVLAARGA